MTPEQLERAARHYCKLVKKNPETIIGHGEYPGWLRWQIVAVELERHWAMNEALKEGMRDLYAEKVMKDMLGDTA